MGYIVMCSGADDEADPGYFYGEYDCVVYCTKELAINALKEAKKDYHIRNAWVEEV